MEETFLGSPSGQGKQSHHENVNASSTYHCEVMAGPIPQKKQSIRKLTFCHLTIVAILKIAYLLQ